MSGLAALFRDDTDAVDAFRDQLELARELVVLPAAFEGLRALAANAPLHGELHRAARLYGAAEAFRYQQPDSVDARIGDTVFALARARHGTEASDTAARAGAALRFRDPIADGEPDDHFGAAPLRGEIELLARRSRIDPPRTPPPPDPARSGPVREPERGATARGVEVFELLAEGLTNGEIAERLYISPRTPGVHVSHTLAKRSAS